ncbi:PEPxxWA-CTERM sorting domain-containing protein [Sphingomonas sp. KC8]|uniref:PEPxxWA-CTERM sorting domain-containing protein n=1 Tax=Sphingomonas sp. KC8 TaxID=1030157 RepID=UPI000A31CA8C|nr:PEPxxWA-CTERM sorting domain-containing protein [Sphingomonas sp. KC8]ARS28622.1 PEP-CTERM domain protein [Sphingomonas sp. KC8]
MKSAILKFAAVASLGLASAVPVQAATTFQVDTSSANTFVTYTPDTSWFSNFSASLSALPSGLKSLAVGESWTFDFIDITITGIGSSDIALESQLSFLSPGGSTAGSASGWYSKGVFTTSGELTWDATSPVTVNGATYLVTFENLSGLSFEHPVTETISATVTLVGEVPEPATWAMMIAGFGLVGTSLRLRAPRRTAARAA